MKVEFFFAASDQSGLNILGGLNVKLEHFSLTVFFDSIFKSLSDEESDSEEFEFLYSGCSLSCLTITAINYFSNKIKFKQKIKPNY